MNPIVRIRKEHNIGRDEFANMAGVSYATLFNAEKNYPNKLNRKILKVTVALGYDPEEIHQEYVLNRKKRQEKLLKQYAK